MMDLTSCSEIQSSLAALFADRVKVSTQARFCIVTLPLQSVDKRRVSLIVERTVGDMFRVHDAGKTDSSLFAQGVTVTKNKLDALRKVATTYGVTIDDDHFIQKLCKISSLNAAILDVAQCAILASQEIITHKTIIEEETISRRLRETFSAWKPRFVEKVVSNVKVPGETATHNFPFVAFPKDSTDQTVAVKVLYATHPQWQAERYGFLVHDLRSQALYGAWKRIAVVSRAEEWPKKSIELVKNLSDETIEVRSGEESDVISGVPSIVGNTMRAKAA